LKGLTAEQFRAWEIYCELEDFTEKRQDYRVASILHILYNINRGKDQPAKQLKDFLLQFDAPEKDPEPEDPKKKAERQFAMLKVLAAMHANEGPPTLDNTPGQVTMADPIEQEMLEQARKAMH